MAMNDYQVLQDAFRTGVGHPFVSGLVWVYDGNRVYVYAGLQFAAQLADADQRLAFARDHGFSESDIWQSLVDSEDVHGYTSIRTGPIDESGLTADDVGLEQLKSFS